MVGESAVAKAARAGEHLASFEEEVTRWADGCRFQVILQPQVKAAEFVWTVHGVEPVPDRLAVIAGDCLSNLRAALDHLVFERSAPVGTFPRCEFPIFEDPTKYAARKTNGDPGPVSGLFKVRGMPPGDQAVIESMQPYHAHDGGDAVLAATCDNLRALHDFNVIDKHRQLHLAVMAVNEFAHTPRPGVRLVRPDGALEDGGVVLRSFCEDPDAEVDLHPGFGLGVAFDHADGLAAASALLWGCHRAVREVLLRVIGVSTDPAPIPEHAFVRLIG